jgi:DNA-binding winged helix-turn-helix (wHTH) protein
VWGPEYRDDLQYLRVWVSRVRRKLGAEPGEPGRIKTFQGIGYLLDIEGTATDAPVGSAGAAERSGTADAQPAGGDVEPAAGAEPTVASSLVTSG